MIVFKSFINNARKKVLRNNQSVNKPSIPYQKVTLPVHNSHMNKIDGINGKEII